jgi:hypothetical protein
MTWSDVWKFLVDNIFAVICFISLFVEIIPVKFDPISTLLKWLNKSVREEIKNMREEVMQNIDSVKEELRQDISILQEKQEAQDDRIAELVKSNEMAEISRIRWEIIEFSNSIDNGQVHIRDEYRHIKDENRRYHDLIDKYDLNNGVIDEEMDKINRHYDQNKDNASIYF